MAGSPRRRPTTPAWVAVLLALTACTAGPADPAQEDAAGVTVAEAGEEPEVMDPETGTGVTEEPCPDAVDPEHGCIYLGVLSDLTDGPFAALAVPITEGQRAFWRRVNEEGGIGGYEVDIDTYTRDTGYDPEEHLEAYRGIEPHVLALAQTLGTSTTRAIVEEMDADDVVGVPASWWSGWDFEEQDAGVVLESGYSYCIEPMIALDWLTTEREQPRDVLVVGFGNGYGLDVAAGAEAWATANDATFLGLVETAPNAEIESQEHVIDEIVGKHPDVVLLAVTPTETGEIVGGAAAQGFVGQFMGSAPTWNPVLFETPAADALRALYVHVSPWNHLEGETAAHQAMRDALGGETATNAGFSYGWVWSYPMKAALQAALDAGELTRQGVREAAARMEVDYEDVLPATTPEVGPDVQRSAVISVPDREVPLGLSTLQVGVTGPTADAYEYTSACSTP